MIIKIDIREHELIVQLQRLIALNDVFKNYDKHLPGARKQTELNIEKFSFDAMKEVIKLELNKLPEFPKQIQLKLPTIKKIELPKLTKI